MLIDIDNLLPVALPRRFSLTVYPNGNFKITERKRPAHEPKRDKSGRFCSPYSSRFRKAPQPTICAFCPLLTTFTHN